MCAAHGDGPWWPPGEAWLSKQSPQAAGGALPCSPHSPLTPPTDDVSPKRTINRELQDKNKTSKVKKLISVAVIPGGYIHRWRRPLLGSVRVTPGGAAGVPEALPEASVHRAVPNATAEHHAQDHLEDLRGGGGRAVSSRRPPGAQGQVSQLSETPVLGWGPQAEPARPTHHDHSDHDGCDADEVQLPREELINFPVAVLLQGRPGGSQRRPSSHPTRQQRGAP